MAPLINGFNFMSEEELKPLKVKITFKPDIFARSISVMEMPRERIEYTYYNEIFNPTATTYNISYDPISGYIDGGSASNIYGSYTSGRVGTKYYNNNVMTEYYESYGTYKCEIIDAGAMINKNFTMEATFRIRLIADSISSSFFDFKYTIVGNSNGTISTSISRPSNNGASYSTSKSNFYPVHEITGTLNTTMVEQ